MKKKIIIALVLAFVAYLFWPKLKLVKAADRHGTEYQLSQELKQRIADEAQSLDEAALIDYSIHLTAELLKFAEHNDIEAGRANCVGYAQLCSSICNYGIKVNHLRGEAKPVVGYVSWAGFNLCDIAKALAPSKYKSFVKDHDFVEYLVKDGHLYASLYFDASLYDLVFTKCKTDSTRHDARFHNAKEIEAYYGVKIPEVVLVDSDYKCLEAPAWFSEYYINTYRIKNHPSKKALSSAIAKLNKTYEYSDGDVEASLLENDTKLQIKFHFVTDSGNYLGPYDESDENL